MRIRTAVGVLTSVAVVVGLATLVDKWSSDEPPETDDLAELRAELEATQRDLAAVKHSQYRRSAQSGLRRIYSQHSDPEADLEEGEERNETEPPAEELDEAAFEKILEREEAATVVRYRKLEADLVSEARDHEWALDTERAYTDQIDQFDGRLEGAKPRLVSMECRSTLCRVELAFSNERDARTHGPQLVRHPSIQRGTFRNIQTPEGVRTVAFVGRGDRDMYPLSLDETS